jgi:hypothetical protein
MLKLHDFCNRALRNARPTTQTWRDFFDDFVDDPEIAARFKTSAPR